MLILSQAPSIPLDAFIQFGLPGVIIALLISGQLALGREVKSMKEERDRYRSLHESVIDHLSSVPASQQAILEALEVVKTVVIGLQAAREERDSK